MQKSYRESGVGMLDAAPGTYLVTAYFDDNQVDLVHCNVLGWQVGKDRRLTPITIDPRAADEDPWYVQHPDGRIESSDGRAWADKDSWIEEQRRAKRFAA